MPDPDAPGLTDDERKERAAAIKAVAGLPEQTAGVPSNRITRSQFIRVTKTDRGLLIDDSSPEVLS